MKSKSAFAAFNASPDLKDSQQIERLVGNPTWREMLIDLVSSEQVDPWNLDIADITNKYIERVKKMKVLDLHIPANVILAASILLRFKAEAWRFEEEVAEEAMAVAEVDERISVEPLQLRMRLPPKRSITLTDLIGALDDVLKIEHKRTERMLIIPQQMEIKLSEYDIGKEMEKVLAEVSMLADAKGWLSFSELTVHMGRKSTREIIFTLMPLLHLCSESKLTLVQEDIFGEILIHLGDEDFENKALNREVKKEVERDGRSRKNN